MSENSNNALVEWYNQNIGHYNDLTAVVQRTLEELIKKNGIDYLRVTSRTKSLESLVKKIRSKGYSNAQAENTDFAAVRIITYIESDVRKICDLITSTFTVHPEKSVDKTKALAIDQVGYRSIHFICGLGEPRLSLDEFSHFKNMLFEVQVRTMLQHAWAEIHYSRGYKFSGVLPRHVNRRLYCLAGTLELADMNFAALEREVDDYGAEVRQRVINGDLNIEINTTSLLNYLSIKLQGLRSEDVEILEDNDISKIIIDELEHFGISSISDLNEILNNDFLDSVARHQAYTTYAGTLRDAMLFSDMDQYFARSWNGNWSEAESYTFEMLKEKYDDQKVEKLFQEKGIRWV